MNILHRVFRAKSVPAGRYPGLLRSSDLACSLALAGLLGLPMAGRGEASSIQGLEESAPKNPIRLGRIGTPARADFLSAPGGVERFPHFFPVAAAFRPTAPKRFVEVPGGVYTLGSREGGEGEEVRVVELPPFSIGRFEVTVAEFAEYVRAVPVAYLPGVAEGQLAKKGETFEVMKGEEKKPVMKVNRSDAEGYCAWLSEKLGVTVRLPTEEEWEAAARGGVRGARYPWGWGTPGGRCQFHAEGSTTVGAYRPNPFGLHDMAGNVAEWCSGEPVVRGGSWAEREEERLRVYRRTLLPEDYRDADVGFRVVVIP